MISSAAKSNYSTDAMQNNRILILDFGSQFTQLIARRIRELRVYCEIHPSTVSLDWIREWDPRGIILSGGPSSVYDPDVPQADPALEDVGVPILGICYGMQLLALEFGGELVYDISSDLPSAGRHRLEGGDGRHGLVLEPGSRLADLLGPGPQAVNRHHHQAVAKPGRGQRVSARADDGLVEAIEAEDGAFQVGVQWHPERMPDPHRERLFAAFAAACGGGGPPRRGAEY